jgi:glutathione S-transferase
VGSGALDAAVLWRFERNRVLKHQSAETLAAFQAKVEHTLAYIENEIEVLEATPFGIGHIAIGCFFGYLDFRFGDIEWRNNQPGSAAWYGQFMGRTSVQSTMPYEPTEGADGPMRRGSIWRTVA